MSALALCRLGEIEEGEAKGFLLEIEGRRRDILVVREGRRVYGYVNSCPHQGTPLEILPDQFLTADGSHILCHTHGALFAIESGLCIAGPCAGASLTPLRLALDEEDRVLLLLGERG